MAKSEYSLTYDASIHHVDGWSYRISSAPDNRLNLSFMDEEENITSISFYVEDVNKICNHMMFIAKRIKDGA